MSGLPVDEHKQHVHAAGGSGSRLCHRHRTTHQCRRHRHHHMQHLVRTTAPPLPTDNQPQPRRASLDMSDRLMSLRTPRTHNAPAPAPAPAAPGKLESQGTASLSRGRRGRPAWNSDTRVTPPDDRPTRTQGLHQKKKASANGHTRSQRPSSAARAAGAASSSTVRSTSTRKPRSSSNSAVFLYGKHFSRRGLDDYWRKRQQRTRTTHQRRRRRPLTARSSTRGASSRGPARSSLISQSPQPDPSIAARLLQEKQLHSDALPGPTAYSEHLHKLKVRYDQRIRAIMMGHPDPGASSQGSDLVSTDTSRDVYAQVQGGLDEVDRSSDEGGRPGLLESAECKTQTADPVQSGESDEHTHPDGPQERQPHPQGQGPGQESTARISSDPVYGRMMVAMESLATEKAKARQLLEQIAASTSAGAASASAGVEASGDDAPTHTPDSVGEAESVGEMSPGAPDTPSMGPPPKMGPPSKEAGSPGSVPSSTAVYTTPPGSIPGEDPHHSTLHAPVNDRTEGKESDCDAQAEDLAFVRRIQAAKEEYAGYLRLRHDVKSVWFHDSAEHSEQQLAVDPTAWCVGFADELAQRMVQSALHEVDAVCRDLVNDVVKLELQ